MAVSAAAAEKQFGLKRHYVHLLLAMNKTTVFINFLEGVAVQVAGCSVGAQDVDNNNNNNDNNNNNNNNDDANNNNNNNNNNHNNNNNNNNNKARTAAAGSRFMGLL